MSRASIVALLLAALAPAGLAQNWLDTPQFIAYPDELRTQCDVDLDGDMDLMLFKNMNNTYPEVTMMLNDGSGVFTPGETVYFPYALSIPLPIQGDLTGDGIDDLVMKSLRGTPNGPGYFVYAGTGTGTFTNPVFLSIEGNPLAATIADMNDDGVMDLGVFHFDTVNDYMIRWFVADGLGGLTSGTPLSVNTPCISLAAIDLDDDGRLDLVGGRWFQSRVKVYYTVGNDLTFGPGLPLSGNAGGGQYLVPGDLDDDGDLDLLVHRYQTGGHEYLTIENQNGTLVEGPGEFLNNADWDTAYLHDWDDDGDLDVITLATTSIYSFKDLEFLSNEGGLTFQYRSTIEMAGQRGPGVGIADYDGDGFADFAGTHSVYFGTGEFDTNVSRLYSWAGEARDWDGDGDLDILRAGNTLDLNDGTGVFTNITPFPPLAGGLRWNGVLAYDDFNGDGILDVIVELQEHDGQKYVTIEWSMLEGRSTGKFGLQGAALPIGTFFLTFSGQNFRALPVDLNEDGFPDLAYHDGFRLNDQNAFFPDHVEAWTDWTPLDAGDFDNNGHVDLVAWKDGVGSFVEIGVLWNDGVSFTPVTYVNNTTQTAAHETLTADLDDDGDQDFAVGVEVFENLGGGTFVSSHVLDRFNDTLAAADIDGDGLTDLIGYGNAGYYLQDAILVYRRTGPGPVYEPSRVYDSRFQVSLAADIDSDGDRDLVGLVSFLSKHHFRSGRIRQFGTGTPGMGGVVPILGADGPTRVGEQAGMHLRRGVGRTPTLLTIGFTESALPDFPKLGMTSYNSPWNDIRIVLARGTKGVPGDGFWDIPFTVPPSLSGLSTFFQAYVADAAASGGLAATNGLEVTFD